MTFRKGCSNPQFSRGLRGWTLLQKFDQGYLHRSQSLDELLSAKIIFCCCELSQKQSIEGIEGGEERSSIGLQPCLGILVMPRLTEYSVLSLLNTPPRSTITGTIVFWRWNFHSREVIWHTTSDCRRLVLCMVIGLQWVGSEDLLHPIC